MEKKIRIPKEKIIAINTRFVYFLENGKVFRANRRLGKRGGSNICMESTRNLLVVKNSIEKIETIWISNSPSLLRILKKHGVKIIR